MNNLDAKADIDRISMEVLRSSKSLDVFPTPVDRILEFADMVVRKDIDISKIHPSYKDRANEFLRNALSKVRGIFEFSSREIILDLSQNQNRKNFVKLHETAHGILPWQKKVQAIIADNDHTLNPDHSEEFEAEANYFASITLFQQDRFIKELKRLDLSIDAAMHLAKHFGGSIHAALRRYVDCSPNKCALLILDNIERGKITTCNLKSYIASSKFEKAFGTILFSPRLGFSHPFVQDFCFGRRYKKGGRARLETTDGSVEFAYQFFNNSYNAFVLIHPVGEIKRSRTTYIIKDLSSI